MGLPIWMITCMSLGMVMAELELSPTEPTTPSSQIMDELTHIKSLILQNENDWIEKYATLDTKLHLITENVEKVAKCTCEQDVALTIHDLGPCYTTQSGNSIVFLNREDGSENFTRTWEDYKNGFGHQSGEFWLGLECLHNITYTGHCQLVVDFGDWEGNVYQATYNTIKVGPESDGYKLTVSGYFSNSTAPDALYAHDYMRFSTIDLDHDNDPFTNCAQICKGGWWYKSCHQVNPTGVYYTGGKEEYSGINWMYVKPAQNHYSYKNMRLTLILT